MAIDRDTFLMIALVGGPPAALTYLLYRGTEYLGPKITLTELLPTPLWEGLPVPRFIRTKPEVWAGLKETIKIVKKAK